MTDPAELEQQYEALDATLALWRQGDYVIGPLGFVVRFNPELHLRSADRNETPDSDLYEDEVEEVGRKLRQPPVGRAGELLDVRDHEVAIRAVMEVGVPAV